MPVNIAKEVAALERMTVRELRLRYAEVFNEETKAGNKAWLIKRIAWRLQSLEEGEVYKSLSGAAKAITGQHCNGFHFFRLGKECVR